MKTDEITVRMTLDEAAELSATIKTLECRLESANDALLRERKWFDEYRAAESERIANERKRCEAELTNRIQVLENNERKNAALEEYLCAKSRCVARIYATVERRLTKTEREKMNAEKRKVDEAWSKFDKVQKEVVK